MAESSVQVDKSAMEKPVVSARKSSTITSIEEIMANGDKTKQFLLKKNKENFDYLNVEILKQQQQHKLAALHFTALFNWTLFVPSIILTLTSSILAILVKSPLIPSEQAETMIALAIAIISIGSTFIQSLSKQLDFSARSSSHQACSTQLRKLLNYTKLSSREAEYNAIFKTLQTGEKLSIGTNTLADLPSFTKSSTSHGADGDDGSKEHGSEDAPKDAEKNDALNHSVPAKKIDDNESSSVGNHDGDDDDDDDEKSKNARSGSSITAQFYQAVETCSSPFPIQIAAAFEILDSRVEMVNKSTLKNDEHTKIRWERVKPCLYYQLSETIIQSKTWPLKIPNAEWSVTQTLLRFKEIVRSDKDGENEASIVDDLIGRAAEIQDINANTNESYSHSVTNNHAMIDV